MGDGIISLRIVFLNPKKEIKLQILISSSFYSHIIFVKKKEFLKATVLVFSWGVFEADHVWILHLD